MVIWPLMMDHSGTSNRTEVRLMMVDTRIYGWYGWDTGTVLCSSCEIEDETLQEHNHNSRIDVDGNVFAPLFSHEDDGRGLPCDACYGFVFEPDEDYCFDCDDWHDSPCEYQKEDV